MDDRLQVRQFLLYVFVLLIPCFALWSVASGPLAVPAIGFVNLVLTHWFPDVVNALYVDGAKALLMTEFGEEGGGAVPLASADYRLGFELNPRVLSYSLPFYTALHFATQKQDYLNSYVWGSLVLYALLAIGLLCLCLKELMVGLGPLFLEQPGVFVPHANVIGILYQFSVLIVPTLAPAALWLWQSKESLLLREALGKG
jgi:hypothetical protein